MLNLIWSRGVWRFCSNSALLMYSFHLLYFSREMIMMMKAVATLMQWLQTGGCEKANQNRSERKGSVVPP